jgi:hypothetical protein
LFPETEQRLFEGQSDTDEVARTPLEKRMVLVVAMHNTMLQNHAQALSLAGVTPLFYEIEQFSAMRAAVDRSLTPVAIIDLGAQSTKLYVIELGIILASACSPARFCRHHESDCKYNPCKHAKGGGVETASGYTYGKPTESNRNVSHASTLVMEQVMAEMRRVLAGFQRRYNKAISRWC